MSLICELAEAEKKPVQDKSGGKLDVFFLLIEVFKFGQISHRRAFSGRVCRGTLYHWHANVSPLIVWLGPSRRRGFHSPPGPLTAAALKSKLTSTGAQTRGLLFFYGQNKILKLEVRVQRHFCIFSFSQFFLFFPLPNCRESSKTGDAAAVMTSSCPRCVGDKPKKINLFQSHQAVWLDCSPAFTPALLRGRQNIMRFFFSLFVLK